MRTAKLISAALAFLLATTFLSAVEPSPSAHAALPAQTVYDDGLHEMGRWTGQYAFSADGLGATGEPNSSGNLQVEKPAGATTVEAAYLTMPSKYNTKPWSPTATLNGSAVTFTHRTGGADETSWQNWLADVTSLVSGTLDAAAAGGADTDIAAIYDSRTGNSNDTDDGGGYTGVALTAFGIPLLRQLGRPSSNLVTPLPVEKKPSSRSMRSLRPRPVHDYLSASVGRRVGRPKSLRWIFRLPAAVRPNSRSTREGAMTASRTPMGTSQSEGLETPPKNRKRSRRWPQITSFMISMIFLAPATLR